MGVRTQTEIDEERGALKALHGDFRDVGGDTTRDQTTDALTRARG